MYVRVENKERQFVNIYLNTFLPTERRLTWELSLIRRDKHVISDVLMYYHQIVFFKLLINFGRETLNKLFSVSIAPYTRRCPIQYPLLTPHGSSSG